MDTNARGDRARKENYEDRTGIGIGTGNSRGMTVQRIKGEGGGRREGRRKEGREGGREGASERRREAILEKC